MHSETNQESDLGSEVLEKKDGSHYWTFSGARTSGEGFWHQKARRCMGTELQRWVKGILDTAPDHPHAVKSAVYPGMELPSARGTSPLSRDKASECHHRAPEHPSAQRSGQGSVTKTSSAIRDPIRTLYTACGDF